MFNPNHTPSPRLQWDSDSSYLLPAEEQRLSLIESTLLMTWQDYLDRKLGWEHPAPIHRVPLLAAEIGVHSCLLPQPEHEEWFLELFGKTTEVHLGSDRYEVDILNTFLFTDEGANRCFGFKVRDISHHNDAYGVSYDGQRVSARFLHHSQVLKRRAKEQRKKK